MKQLIIELPADFQEICKLVQDNGLKDAHVDAVLDRWAMRIYLVVHDLDVVTSKDEAILEKLIGDSVDLSDL